MMMSYIQIIGEIIGRRPRRYSGNVHEITKAREVCDFVFLTTMATSLQVPVLHPFQG